MPYSYLLYCHILYHDLLHFDMLYYNMLFSLIRCAVIRCTVISCTVIYCHVLYCCCYLLQFAFLCFALPNCVVLVCCALGSAVLETWAGRAEHSHTNQELHWKFRYIGYWAFLSNLQPYILTTITSIHRASLNRMLTNLCGLNFVCRVHYRTSSPIYCSAWLKLNPKTGLNHHHHHHPTPPHHKLFSYF